MNGHEFRHEDLYPLLRSGEQAVTRPEDQVPAHRRPTDMLAEVLAHEVPDGLVLLPSSTIAFWGLNEDDLFQQARKNLRGRLSDDTFGYVDLDTGGDVAALRAQGPPGLEASWVFLPDVINELLALDVDGERYQPQPILFAPNDTTLFIAAELSTDSLRRLLEITEAVYDQADQPIARYPLTFDDDGALIPWFPGAGHPLREAVLRAYALGQQRAYATQQASYDESDWGQETLQETGDVLLNLEIMPSWFTKATLTQDVSRVLTQQIPAVDFVELRNDAGETVLLTCEQFLAVAWEPCMDQDPTYHPPRYRLREWPDRWTWSRLEQNMGHGHSSVPWPDLLPLLCLGLEATARPRSEIWLRSDTTTTVSQAAIIGDLRVPQVVRLLDAHDWEVTLEDLMIKARENLRLQRHQDTFFRMDYYDGGQCLIASQPEGLQSSWALLPDVVEAIQPGGILFFPARDKLFIVDPSDRTGILETLQAAEGFYRDAAHPISPLPHRYDGDSLDVWFPEDAELNTRVRKVVCRFMKELYTEQRAVYESTSWGRDHLDAKSLVRLGIHDNEIQTYCELNQTRAEKGNLLLPEMHFIWLLADDGQERWVTWERFVAACPGATGYRADLTPSRWQLHRWPTPEEWAELDG